MSETIKVRIGITVQCDDAGDVVDMACSARVAGEPGDGDLWLHEDFLGDASVERRFVVLAEIPRPRTETVQGVLEPTT